MIFVERVVHGVFVGGWGCHLGVVVVVSQSVSTGYGGGIGVGSSSQSVVLVFQGIQVALTREVVVEKRRRVSIGERISNVF